MKWFAIFKTGTHTDSSGNTKNWTEEDIDKIVNNYDPQKNEAPIVIGHPKTNAPAFGWIEKLKRVGDTLYALPKQVANDFVEMVKKGLFKKRSISLYPDGTLRHVGFLGATPPAVKGLPDVEFKDENNIQTIEFEQSDQSEPKGLDEQDKTDTTPKDHSDHKDDEQAEIIKELKEKTEKMKVEFAESVRARIKAEEELEKLRLKIRKAEFEQFLNERLAYGNILPAQVGVINDLLMALSSVEFADRTDKPSPLEQFKEFLVSLPKVIDLSNPKPIPSDRSDNVSSIELVSEEIRKQMSNI